MIESSSGRVLFGTGALPGYVLDRLTVRHERGEATFRLGQSSASMFLLDADTNRSWQFQHLFSDNAFLFAHYNGQGWATPMTVRADRIEANVPMGLKSYPVGGLPLPGVQGQLAFRRQLAGAGDVVFFTGSVWTVLATGPLLREDSARDGDRLSLKGSSNPSSRANMFDVEKFGKKLRFASDCGPEYHAYFARNELAEDDFLSYTRALGLSGTYLDIGANCGQHSVFWGKCTQADRVEAFEPLNTYSAVAAKNVVLNGLEDRVRLHRIGLGDKRAQIALDFRGASDTCQIERLDDIADDLNIKGPITLVKLDIEGMEPAALTGATALLKKYKPVVFCEVIQPEGTQSIDDTAMRAVLEPLGYRATGRVFNYQPTVEFVHPRSPVAKSMRKPKRKMMALQKWSASQKTVTVRSQGDDGIELHLDASPRVYLTSEIVDFSKPIPKASNRVKAMHGEQIFLEIEANEVGTANAAFLVNFYDNSALLEQKKIWVNRRKAALLNIPEGTKSLRIIVDSKGTGFVNIRKIAVTRFPEE